MSDYDDYEDDEMSLDDVLEDEVSGDYGGHDDWSDNLDDMDSEEWGEQYGYSSEELSEDEVDPWDLN